MNTFPTETDGASRVALAVEQLHVAIDLFLRNVSHASALTLAGAAEEILAKKAERFGNRPSIERQYEVLEKLLSHGKRPAPNKKAFFNERNAIRNQLKHFDRKEPEWLEGDVTSGAVHMIGRACANYELCGLPPTDRMQEFYGWYYSQISES